jgi:hypothetical protein
MTLGVAVGYWGGGSPADAAAIVAESERLGLDSVWTAEAYGCRALLPLAWYAAGTSTVRLPTNSVQTSAHTPAATAVLTVDHLSGGRFVLGLGACGPQVVEGWYGQAYPKPPARTREHAEILGIISVRRAPVEYQGMRYRPPNDGGVGPGKPLKNTMHPLRSELPIYLTAERPDNLAPAAEMAEGWLPFLFSPGAEAFYPTALPEGFTPPRFPATARQPRGRGVRAGGHRRRCRGGRGPDPPDARALVATGVRNANFHRDVLARLGHEADCAHIQDRYLAGGEAGAVAAVPASMVQDVALVDPRPDRRIAEMR